MDRWEWNPELHPLTEDELAEIKRNLPETLAAKIENIAARQDEQDAALMELAALVGGEEG